MMPRNCSGNLSVRLFAKAVFLAVIATSVVSAAIDVAEAEEAAPTRIFYKPDTAPDNAPAKLAGTETKEPAGAGAGAHRQRSRARELLNLRVQWRKQKARLDAKRFSTRIKRHLGRRFARRKQNFRRHQVLIEKQRRALRRRKARNKAHQFAAARRHAARHKAKHRAKHGGKPAAKLRGLTFKKPQSHELRGALP